MYGLIVFAFVDNYAIHICKIFQNIKISICELISLVSPAASSFLISVIVLIYITLCIVHSTVYVHFFCSPSNTLYMYNSSPHNSHGSSGKSQALSEKDTGTK